VLRNLSQTGHLSSGQESEGTKALLRTVTHLTGTLPGFLEDQDVTLNHRLEVMHQLICDPLTPGSIFSNVNNLLRATYAVRDKWSVDNWRIIDDIENVKRRLGALEAKNIRLVFPLLDEMNLGLLSFLEMNRQSMYRGEGWVMYRVGQILEELLLELAQYRSLLTVACEESVEFQILEALLVSNQSLSNYRSVYRTYFDTAPAVDLLFFNRQNPISVIAQLEQLVDYMERLPKKEDQRAHDSEIARLAFQSYSLVRLASIDELMKVDQASGIRVKLDELCETLTDQISRLSVMLSAHYFSHSSYQHQGTRDSFQFEV